MPVPSTFNEIELRQLDWKDHKTLQTYADISSLTHLIQDYNNKLNHRYDIVKCRRIENLDLTTKKARKKMRLPFAMSDTTLNIT